jgi:hypothetical protein
MKKQVCWVYQYSVLAYIVTSIVTIHKLYKLVRFLFPYCKTNTALKAISAFTTGASGRGNILVVIINIKTSNESIASHPKEIPLQTLEQVTDLGETEEVSSSRRIKVSHSYF